MNKIRTIFERDSNMKITTNQVVDLTGCVATEKVDGTNVRLTVRNHTLVRLEKRRNPSKLEKAKGIITPWYVDASEFSPEDKYMYEAAKNTDLSHVEDGEWSGEAFGPKIQGNPLNTVVGEVFLFSDPIILSQHTLGSFDLESSFEDIRDYLKTCKSTFNPECGIEGMVFWRNDEPVGKIKLKDFNH